jgi:hypothetical protein
MTLTLDIRPEVQAELARQAALQGRAIESVAAALLESAVRPASAGPPAAVPNGGPGEPKNLFDLFAPVRGLLTDDEIDTLFARNRSMSRPVDLS